MYTAMELDIKCCKAQGKEAPAGRLLWVCAGLSCQQALQCGERYVPHQAGQRGSEVGRVGEGWVGTDGEGLGHGGSRDGSQGRSWSGTGVAVETLTGAYPSLLALTNMRPLSFVPLCGGHRSCRALHTLRSSRQRSS